MLGTREALLTRLPCGRCSILTRVLQGSKLKPKVTRLAPVRISSKPRSSALEGMPSNAAASEGMASKFILFF